MKTYAGIATALVLAGIGTGCHKRVTIDSEPAGARVWVNGRDYGRTPVTLDLEYNIFLSYQVQLEKEGYQRAFEPLPGEPKLGVAICGYILCPPLLIWAREPISEVTYVLAPAPPGDPPPATSPKPPSPPPPPPSPVATPAPGATPPPAQEPPQEPPEAPQQ